MVINDRTDVAVVGSITPDIPFYITQKNSTDKSFNYLLYNSSGYKYILATSAITYYSDTTLTLPDNYVRHYFKYSTVSGDDYDNFFTIQAYLDPECTKPAGTKTNNYLNYDNVKKILSTSTTMSYFTFNVTDQYPNDGFLLHTGVQGKLQSRTTGLMAYDVSIECYNSDGTKITSGYYTDMPLGIDTTNKIVFTNIITSFFPVVWYNKYGFPVNNPIYHYCPSQTTASGSFYTNFCTMNYVKGNTLTSDNSYANGLLYYYPTTSDGKCGSKGTAITNLINQIETPPSTYQVDTNNNICHYDGNTFNIITKPKAIDDNINIICQNSDSLCNLNFTGCSNISTTCKPYCQSPDCCSQASIKSCGTAGENACKSLYPCSDGLSVISFVIIGILGFLLLISTAIAVYYWMHRCTDDTPEGNSNNSKK